MKNICKSKILNYNFDINSRLAHLDDYDADEVKRRVLQHAAEAVENTEAKKRAFDESIVNREEPELQEQAAKKEELPQPKLFEGGTLKNYQLKVWSLFQKQKKYLGII